MTECWFSARALTANGYSLIWDGSKNVYAHRVIYEDQQGEIPLGLEIDHLCRNRNCINPQHLEAVTRSINTLRGLGPTISALRNRAKTHCPQGHPYAGANLYIAPKHPERRDCRTCRKLASRRFRERKEALA